MVLAALSARVNTKITTFWARNNVLLVVNAGLLAVGVNQRSGPRTAVLLALVGVTTAMIWLVVAKRG